MVEENNAYDLGWDEFFKPLERTEPTKRWPNNISCQAAYNEGFKDAERSVIQSEEKGYKTKWTYASPFDRY